MPGDWIKLHRKILKSAVMLSPEILKLWVICMLKANWKDGEAQWSANSDPIKVKRGQFLTGRDALHKDYYGAYRGDKACAKTVWRWLKKLEKQRKVVLENVQRCTLVTLCNYDTYQDVTDENVHQLVQAVSTSCPGGVQVVSTIEEGKELQEGKEGQEDTLPSTTSNADIEGNGKPKKRRKTKHEYHPDFLTFYEAYPRSVGIAPAYKEWQKAGKGLVLSKGMPKPEAVAFLLEAATAFAGSLAGQRGTMTPHPSSWLSAMRYMDDRADWDLSDENNSQKSLTGWEYDANDS